MTTLEMNRTGGLLESALVCTDDPDNYTLAIFRIDGEIATCTCMKNICMQDPALIESSCVDDKSCWIIKKTNFERYSEYSQTTAIIHRDSNMGGFFRCELVFRDEVINNLLNRYTWTRSGTEIWSGTWIWVGLPIVFVLMAHAFMHAIIHLM